MKKVLSILLVIALAATLFAGCGKKTPDPSGTPDPSPTPTVMLPNYADDYSDVIKFNLYDEADYMTRWSNSSKEWMYENFHLAIENSLPAVADDGLAVESSRKAYTAAINLLFAAEATRPDYMPALKAASTGADACFKELGPNYLADLSPYIEENQILHNYVTWLWADGEDYWKNVKQAFEVNGKLYALPRREMMPVQEFLVYAEGLLQQINIKWDELPTTWDGFVDLLKAFKNLSDDYIPFVAYDVKLDGLLKFIAATYGLDFSLDFSWTTKNGEPLWTYYWDEYLQILTRANELAAEGLVYTDAKKPNSVVHYDFEDKSAGRKPANQSWKMNTETGKSIASYTTSAQAGIWASSGWAAGTTGWRISQTMVSQNGYEYSLIGTSQIDESWVAVGNRLGQEFVLRICDMISFSLTDYGYVRYFFGKEGDPFADSVEEAGNFIYVEDENGEKKIRWLGNNDRLGGPQDNPDFYTSIDEHYSKFTESGVSWDEEESEGDISDQYGITDTGYYPGWRNFKVGTIMYADVTSYPMQMSIYWEKEWMSKDAPCIEELRAGADASNSYVYDGLYRTPTDYLGSKDGAEMETKMSNLKAIAKDFTIGFLGHTRSASDWDNYIKSLQEAGYDDVYEFYSRTAYSFPTSYVDGVMSQSSVNAKRNK